jgi:hypothetical protein
MYNFDTAIKHRGLSPKKAPPNTNNKTGEEKLQIIDFFRNFYNRRKIIFYGKGASEVCTGKKN